MHYICKLTSLAKYQLQSSMPTNLLGVVLASFCFAKEHSTSCIVQVIIRMDWTCHLTSYTFESWNISSVSSTCVNDMQRQTPRIIDQLESLVDLLTLLSQDIITIEGLKLDHVKAGIYMLHCLPLRLIGCDGSPIRCILIK